MRKGKNRNVNVKKREIYKLFIDSVKITVETTTHLKPKFPITSEYYI